MTMIMMKKKVMTMMKMTMNKTGPPLESYFVHNSSLFILLCCNRCLFTLILVHVMPFMYLKSRKLLVSSINNDWSIVFIVVVRECHTMLLNVFILF